MDILVVMTGGRVTFKEGEATGWNARDDGILEIRKGKDVVGTFRDWAYVRTTNNDSISLSIQGSKETVESYRAVVVDSLKSAGA